MLALFGNIMTAILGGGVTGLLGSVLTGYIEIRKQKLIWEHKEHMLKLEHALIKMERDSALAIARVVADERKEVAESAAFEKSFAADRAAYMTWRPKSKVGEMLVSILFLFIDFVRGLIRPALTVYLCILTTWLYIEVRTIAGPMTLYQAFELMSQISYVILYLTTSVVLWWFGTRNKVFTKET